MVATQPVQAHTPLGEDLQFSALKVREELGRPFYMDLSLVSEDENLAFDDVLGLPASVELETTSGAPRFFHGLISDFAQIGRRGAMAAYTMQLRPWLWFLSRSSDCRIFQQTTVPDILKEVFREYAISEFEDCLSESYRPWEYLVQYRETDFNFVSRLMEQEGIYYYFKHERDKHTLVLADGYGAHSPLPDNATIPYYPPSDNVQRDVHVHEWSVRRQVSSGSFVQRAYDYTKPGADLETYAQLVQGHAEADYEIFDYPGEYFEKPDGENYAKTRLQELQAGYERSHGVADVRGIVPGSLFSLAEHPRDDQNREYLVVAAEQHVQLGDYASNSGNDFHFECRFEAMDSSTQFRALRLTPKPVVQGPQTAEVVGPSGEEIWTDKYGRVKVQFHWDRYGQKDENSSCWVRVAQVWAGSKWGAMYIPRMGHEVIVNFVEGDPDRPIITGRVYNAKNMPPYSLPADQTKSTIQSRSSKGGTADNFNEIRFEDKKGSEELYFHAEKDQVIVVENDKTESVGHDNKESIGNDESIEVGHDRAKKVVNDQSEDIGKNKTITVGVDHTEQIGANESKNTGADKTVVVGANHSETVGANQSITIASNQTENVGSNVAQTVGGAKAETIAKAKALSIGGGYQVTVGGAKNQTIGGAKAEQVGGDSSIDVAKKTAFTSGDDFSIDGGKKGMITIADELSITVGKASIVLKKNGDITINGKKISVKASGDIVMKGSKILQN